MAEQPRKREGVQTPALSFFLVAPTSLVLSLYVLQSIYTVQGFLPAYIPKDVTKMTYRCLGLSTLPLFLFVFVVMNFRVLTRAGNTLLNAESPLMQVQIKTLTNTLEQTVIFVLNLLAFSTHAEATPERIALFTFFFIAGRLVYWVGYNLMYYTNLTIYRGPGMTMTIATSAFLFYHNAVGLISVL